MTMNMKCFYLDTKTTHHNYRLKYKWFADISIIIAITIFLFRHMQRKKELYFK